MIVELLLPQNCPRRWHGWLSLAMRRAGAVTETRLVECAVASPLPRPLDWLLMIDRTLHGAGEHALDRVPMSQSRSLNSRPQIAIDLTGGIAPSTGVRHILPLFDSAPGEAGLWSALLDGRAPRLDLYDVTQDTVIPIGLPATETPHQLMASANQVIARLIQGIVRTVQFNLAGIAGEATEHSAVRLPPTKPFMALRNMLAIKSKRELRRRTGREPQWRVAWRASTGTSVIPKDGELHIAQWTVLPDDGQRYYADPFPFAHEGRRYLFVEEFPTALGRGLISVVEIGVDGRALSVPQPVLEAPFHLSYPQIFEHGGVIFMLPEAAESGRLTLYRAERFPDRWVEVGDLLQERVHDATLLSTPNGFWLFATSEGDGGSSWDALHLYRAPELMGPWTAHDRYPVLVDAGAARPAGAFFWAGDALWRPVQDCRKGYGAGLGFARIDCLDGNGFRQTVVHKLSPPALGGFEGVHTWNRAAGLDTIDVFGPAVIGVK